MAITVMIVEVDILNMKLLNDLLVVKGYDVVLHTGDVGAFEAICDQHPDLILMGLNLPGRASLTITAALKENNTLQHIPVIAIAEHPHQNDRRTWECDGLIAKPISINAFYETVSELIPAHLRTT